MSGVISVHSTVGGSVVLSDIGQLSTVIEKVTHRGEGSLQFSIDPEHCMSRSSINVTSMSRSELKLIYHAKYVYNFCRQTVPNQVESLIQEVRWATQLGCDVVIHQGKNVATEHMSKLEAITNYVRNVTEVIEQTPDSSSRLLLENSAGQGTELGFTLTELSYIYNQFDDVIRERIGICLDTCHIFASGQLDLRNVGSVKTFLGQFDQSIGLDKLGCLHLNDSDVQFGQKKDRHGDFMRGYITNPLLGGCVDGLSHLVSVVSERDIPIVFETPCSIDGMYGFQTRLVKTWIDHTSLSEEDQLFSHNILNSSE
jgi:deoxyribonuclease IV